MLRISHTTLLPDQAEVQIKVGSLQRFCPHECTAEDIGTAGFDVDQVHAIGVFDARIFNMDRNSDNLLVASTKPKLPAGSYLHAASRKGSSRTLVPIDHGYTYTPQPPHTPRRYTQTFSPYTLHRPGTPKA